MILTSVLIVGGFLILDAENAVVDAAGTPETNIQITEIMYDLSGSDSNHEWVELKNIGSEAVEIIGGSGAGSWRFFVDSNHILSTSTVLAAGEYLVVVQDTNVFLTDHPGFGNKIVESSFSLNNTSGALALRIESSGEKWSEILYENTWGGSGNGKSLEKKNLTGDNSASNWQESAAEGGTPGADNSAGQAPVPPPSNPPENSLPSSPPPAAPPAPAEDLALVSNCLNNVIVNELLINPEDGGNEAEFVELYNQSNQKVDLSGWILEDTQGKTKTYAIPNGVNIGPSAFRVFYGSETKIIFNNSGDGVKLFDAGKSWCDNSPANSGAAKEGFSFSREGAKWFWTAAVTPGNKNEVNPERETAKVAEVIDGDTIKLSDGRKVRYIGINAPELGQYNQEAECFSREAWEKNKELVLGKEVILERDISDTDNYGRLLRYVYLKNDIFINDYLAREGFTFSAHYPPDNKYQTQLAEAQKAAQAGQKGLWQTCQSKAVGEVNKNLEIISLVQEAPILIILNEFLPNPSGPDNEKEFIELKNFGDIDVNLARWRLEDSNRQKYYFSASHTIAQKGFLVVWRKESKIALNNSKGETVKLFTPDHQLIDEVSYQDTADENFSYSRVSATSAVWQWSKVTTPGVANVINLPNRPPVVIFELPNMAEVGEEIVFDASDTDDPEGDALSFLWDFGDGSQSVQEMATHTFQKSGRRKIILKVNDHQGNEVEQKGYLTVLGEGETASVADSENSTKSKSNQKSSGKEQRSVVGIVTVPPGLFSIQTFYLQDLQDAAGLQIYMFKKDFPSLQVGDKVEVAGEMSAIQSGTRLKIKSRSDIKVLTRGLMAEPEELVVGDLSEEYLSSLVKVSGEVLEPKAGQFYLSDDSGEVMIQFKPRSGLKGRIVKEGDLVEIVGILGQSKGDWRIWPRFVEDIKITGFSGEEANGPAAADEEKKTAKKYLTATAGGLTSLLLALFAKSRGASAKGLALGLISRVSFWKRKIDKE